MEILASPLDWTTNDEQVWAQFLATPTGSRLLPKLAEFSPMLLARGDVNEILIRSGEVRGIQSAIQTLLQLAHPDKPLTPGSEYPSLEDDSKWSGDKLDTQK